MTLAPHFPPIDSRSKVARVAQALLLVSLVLCLSGCTAPPAIISLFVGACACLVLAVVAALMWAFGLNPKPVVSSLMYLVSIFGMLVGNFVHWRLRRRDEAGAEPNDHQAALAASAVGAVCFAGLFSISFLVVGHPLDLQVAWWASGVFFFMLLLYLGASVVDAQQKRVEDEIDSARQLPGGEAASTAHHRGRAQTQPLTRPSFSHVDVRVHKLHLYHVHHYMSFLVAPVVVWVMHGYGWVKAENLLAFHFAVASLIMMLCIVLAVILAGTNLGQQSPMAAANSETRARIQAWYKIEFEWRLLYVLDIGHNLLICSVYGTALAVASGHVLTKAEWVSGVTFFCAAVAIGAPLFILLPFYLGQFHAVRRAVLALKALPAENSTVKDSDDLQKDLLKLRPLFPKSVPLKSLLVAGTAGGLATSVLAKAFEAVMK